MSSPADQSSTTTTAQTTLVVRAEPVVSDIARVNVPVATSPAPAQGPGEMMQMLMMLHRSLRGRYLLAIVLALIGGALGAFGMAKYRRPLYHSEGLIRIAYTLPEAMGETDQNKPMDLFDSFVASQKVLLTSQTIVQAAVLQPAWHARNQVPPDDANRYFAEHVDIDIRPRSEFILIKVTDEIAERAAAAVDSLVAAYEEKYNSMMDPALRNRENVLGDQKVKLANDRTGIQDEIDRDAKVKQYGTVNLDPFYESAVHRFNKLDEAIGEIEVAVAEAPTTKPVEQAAAVAAPAPPIDVTPEEIAIHDQEMAHRLGDRRKLDAEVRRLRSTLGDAHRLTKAAEADRDEASAAVDEYLTFCRDYQRITGQNLSDPRAGAAATAGKTLEQLKFQKKQLTDLCGKAEQEMQGLGNARLALQKKQAQMLAISEEYDRVAKRLDLLQGEKQVGTRLAVIGAGEAARTPDRDVRMKLIAGAGLLGMGLPVAALVGLGFMRRRYKYADEPEADVASSMPLLGILPELNNSDDEETGAAAHSVHQIRVALQARAGPRRSLVYLVTSATAGEGKTSFTTSLGLSFAVSGMRTLIIDCDLVGRSLSGAMQDVKVPGLAEALQDGNVKKYVRKVTGDLYVLSSGEVESSHASALAATRFSAVLSDARRYFNVILVDTGPILGSIEAAVIAPLADATVMVVARGQTRRLVRHALQKLRSLNASAIGFVYNRANSRDFNNSPYGSSSSGATLSRLARDERASADHHAADTVPAERLQSLRSLGPLVTAVSSAAIWKEELSVLRVS